MWTVCKIFPILFSCWTDQVWTNTPRQFTTNVDGRTVGAKELRAVEVSNIVSPLTNGFNVSVYPGYSFYRYEHDNIVDIKQWIVGNADKFIDITKMSGGDFETYFSSKSEWVWTDHNGDGSTNWALDYPSNFPMFSIDRVLELNTNLPYEVVIGTNNVQTKFGWQGGNTNIYTYPQGQPLVTTNYIRTYFSIDYAGYGGGPFTPYRQLDGVGVPRDEFWIDVYAGFVSNNAIAQGRTTHDYGWKPMRNLIDWVNTNFIAQVVGNSKVSYSLSGTYRTYTYHSGYYWQDHPRDDSTLFPKRTTNYGSYTGSESCGEEQNSFQQTFTECDNCCDNPDGTSTRYHPMGAKHETIIWATNTYGSSITTTATVQNYRRYIGDFTYMYPIQNDWTHTTIEVYRVNNPYAGVSEITLSPQQTTTNSRTFDNNAARYERETSSYGVNTNYSCCYFPCTGRTGYQTSAEGECHYDVWKPSQISCYIVEP